MAEEANGRTEKFNGGDEGESYKESRRKDDRSLYSVLSRTISGILFPDPDTVSASTPLLRRIKNSLAEDGQDIREASRNTGRQILLWTRSGSPFRALFVITVGTVTLLAMTGLLVFMLFFLAATLNAVIISLFISLAAAGGFLALFFACVTAIYIGALSIAAFVVSTATISAIVCVLIASGWIAFFWVVWLTTKQTLHIAKKSLSATGSAISTYSSTQRSTNNREVTIASN